MRNGRRFAIQRALIVAVIGGILLLSGTIAQAAAVFGMGTDCWTTTAPSTAALPAFPPGFFTASGGRTSLAVAAQTINVVGNPVPPVPCDCAAPTMRWFDQHGNPVSPGDKHAVSQTLTPSTADTCVKRNQNANLTAIGTPAPVPIEIVALQLRSATPISVPMSSGGPCDFHVHITLFGSQSVGSLTLTPMSSDLMRGSLTLGSLPVGTQLDFTPVNACNDRPNLTGGLTTFQGTTGEYRVPSLAPAVSPWGMAALAAVLLIGMTLMLLWRRRQMNEA